MTSVTKSKVIGKGSKACHNCGQVKSYSKFYVRSGYGTSENPATMDGHFVSECIACMKERGKKPNRLEPWISRVKSEQIAIEYFMSKGIWATTGKMTNAPDVDLALWGVVWCECKFGVLQSRGYKQSCTFNFTPAQQERGLLAHIILLIVDHLTHKTYHLFPADDPVFYKDDGISLKSGVVYTIGKREIETRGRGYKHQLTDPIMNAAQDNVNLVWQWMQLLQRSLCEGERPEYGEPFAR